jgi:ribosomal protein L7/L12/outer membrane protein assembly factor BamB
MSENLPKTLTCPSCGAPLEFDGRNSLVKCKFCKTTVLMPGIPAAQDASGAASLAEIRDLAQAGNMIDAIRRYREVFAVGLREAKEAVESLASGSAVEARQVVTGPLTAEETGRVLEQVQELLREDKKVEAIRRYRESADVSLTKAKEVVDRVEAALKGLPMPPRVEIEPLESQAVEIPTWQSRQTRQSRLGLWITLAVLLLVGGLLTFIFFSVGGPFNSMMIPNGPAILLPSDSAVPDIAAAFYDVNDETYRIGLLEGERGKLRWRSEPLPGDGRADAIAHTGNLVIVAAEEHLLAYQVEDGSIAWQATMPDKLQYGDANLLVMGERVLTLNLDQSVQAYDATTGALAWHRRLRGYERDLRDLGGWLVLFDQVGEDYNYSLFFLDPADGSERRVLTPTCQVSEYSSETLDPDAGLFLAADENALYLVYDSSQGCIQRVDLATEAVTWQTLDDDWYRFSSDGFIGLITENQLIYSNAGQLLAVERTTGQLQVLLEEEDYEFLPLAVSGDALILRARWTRGTERFEVRSLGGIPWQVDLGDTRPIDPPDEMTGLVDDGESGYTWHLVGGQLVLIQFQAKPNQLLIQHFNLLDGTSAGEEVIALKSVSGDFYSTPTVIGWQDDLIFFKLESKIYCVNVTTGEVVFQYQ